VFSEVAMSNFEGGRARFDQKVRFRAPNPNQKLLTPPRPPKHSLPKNYPFNPGHDLSTILKRFGGPAGRRVAPPPLKKDKAPQELPIYKHKDEIIRCAHDATKVLLIAETGSGKTTTAPAFINGEGFKVTVLGPRRLPASELAAFGAKTRNEYVGESIGFAHSLERQVSKKSEIVYATEGYELARQLHNPLSDDHVLIFDEFHERTANAIVLLGFYKMREAQGFPVPKIWIMTATPNKDQLVQYLDNPAVISVEGRKYTITEVARGASPSADAVRFLQQGINPLSFHYGVKDIENHIDEVRREAPEGSTVFPLHSKMSRDQQREAIEPRPNKAVAATNTAQTSLTLEGMGAVIITGKIRRLVLDKEGVPSLIIDDITQDEYRQQMGRVGRTQDGFVVSHGKPFNELRPHAPSEIQNMPLETLILRLAAAPTPIPFAKINHHLIDQPSEKHIRLGYKVLHDLGLTGPQGHVTELGRRVAQLPVDARMGKLLIKALDYQKQHKVDILDDAIRIAAVVEAGGILSGDSKQWERLAAIHKGSDLIKQASLFQRAQSIPAEQRIAVGIDEVNFQRARDIERMLRRRLELPEEAPVTVSQQIDRRPSANSDRHYFEEPQPCWLSRAIIDAHVDSVFRFVRRNEAGDYLYKPLTGNHLAVLQKESVVGGAALIVGSRFNIGYIDDNGMKKVLPLLLNAHEVDEDLEWLEMSTPGHLAMHHKDGIGQAFRKPQKKQKGMISRDLRGGKSFRNGKSGFGGSW
jgi:HrpA-like RNA helicase